MMSKPINTDAINVIDKLNIYNNANFNIKTCKLPELKSIARYYKIRITGTKPELVERITTYIKKNKCATIIQSVFRSHLVRLSIRLRGCCLKDRKLCVNDSDFYTLDPISEIEHNDFYSYTDKKGFIYGFSVSSLISLFKRKGNITNPYNREKMDFKTMNEIFLIYKLNRILYPTMFIESSSPAETIQVPTPVQNVPVILPNMNTNVQEAVETQITSPDTTPPIPVISQSGLSERMNMIQSRTIDERIQELFMEIDQLGNYTQSSWFSNLSERGLIYFYRYIYDIWSHRGQLTAQVKHNICPLQDPFSNIFRINLQLSDINELRKHCLYVMEHMVYTGTDIEYQKIGALHVLSALTLVSLQARQSMYWLYEGLIY
jgi:hypothetical protein